MNAIVISPSPIYQEFVDSQRTRMHDAASNKRNRNTNPPALFSHAASEEVMGG
jgi:hypothetical protein